MRSRNCIVYTGLTSFSAFDLGFITWLVFLILKLCNKTNPNFEWLTWFWVWFPFWLPWALSGVLWLLALLLAGILVYVEDK